MRHVLVKVQRRFQMEPELALLMRATGKEGIARSKHVHGIPYLLASLQRYRFEEKGPYLIAIAALYVTLDPVHPTIHKKC